ncbi:MAG: RNA polymerase sigma factor [Polyangiales bacterium]
MDRLERLGTLARDRAALIGIARSEGLTAEESLECVQDALLTMLSRDEESDHELATVKHMVRNAARNFRRRHRRALPHEPFDDSALAGENENAEGLVAHAEDVVRLRMCVAELCGVQRSVVMLRLLEERSGEDVADTLGITRGHVDVLVHRAKAALRVCMRHSA